MVSSLVILSCRASTLISYQACNKSDSRTTTKERVRASPTVCVCKNSTNFHCKLHADSENRPTPSAPTVMKSQLSKNGRAHFPSHPALALKIRPRVSAIVTTLEQGSRANLVSYLILGVSVVRVMNMFYRGRLPAQRLICQRLKPWVRRLLAECQSR